MNLSTSEKSDIIRRINLEISQISKLAKGDLRIYLKNKLITPSWCLSLDSVLATIKHYESIMNQAISEQLKGVDPMNLPPAIPDDIINHIADILIILSFVVEFAEEDEDEEFN